ncbi:DUF6431 domain-containing protein [Streptomyces sp. NBC_00212]|uniref:DUF6431 domain-containing protein n=1 Tax=Streptomyces sp. NBC_00212 TaxID=2975684 RepID=UPI002F91022F
MGSQQHELLLARAAMVVATLVGCGRHLFVIVVAESETSVMPSCPACDASLRPWGYARERTIRLPEGGLRRLRPRRARCPSCRTTHVLLPPYCLLRRVDSVHTIAAALLDQVAGHGHRRIAERRHRPATTVRGWLRRARARAAFWSRHGMIYAYRLTPDAGPFQPRATELAEALDVLGGGRPRRPGAAHLMGLHRSVGRRRLDHRRPAPHARVNNPRQQAHGADTVMTTRHPAE